MQVQVKAADTASCVISKRNPAFLERTPAGESQLASRQSKDEISRHAAPEAPLVERVPSLCGDLSKDPRPRLRAVDDREDAHVLKSRQKERAPRRGPFDFGSNRV